MNQENLVAFARDGNSSYPLPPFSPSERYPEYPFRHVARSKNSVYGLVRNTLKRLGLDRERQETSAWNPLGEMVRPGDKVVVKPNWVVHENRGPGTVDSVVTHPSIVRALLDYIHIALKGEGTVIVGDAPLQRCKFEEMLEIRNWRSIPEFFSENGRMRVVLEDWRLELFESPARPVFRKRAQGAPERFAVIDLGSDSLLEPVSEDYRNFRVTNYDPEVLRTRHRPGKHEYLVSRRILDADVVFNVPKLKSHKKAGMTCCLKNMVGINGHKSYLPHHRRGPATSGHDEYPAPSFLKSLHTRLVEQYDVTQGMVAQFALALAAFGVRAGMKLGDDIREGSWHGNDTLWRTILDLNRMATYASRDGVLEPSPQRRVFCLVDAVVSGEGEGPMRPADLRLGAVLAGANSLAVDLVAAKLMGFDFSAIPQLSGGLRLTSPLLFNGSPETIIVAGEEREPLDRWPPRVAPHQPAPAWHSVST